VVRWRVTYQIQRDHHAFQGGTSYSGVFGRTRYVLSVSGSVTTPTPLNGSHRDSAALPGDLPQKWGFVKDGKEVGFRKSLGWWLRNHEGRYAGVQKRSWAPGRTARENSGHGVRGTLVDQAEVFPAYPYRISAGQRGGDYVEQLTRPAEIFGIKISWTATPRLG
jgi:hypothetical protein